MKKKILVKGPALSASGYGEQARFLLRSLRKKENELDIYLLNISWGQTGRYSLDQEEALWMQDMLAKTKAYLQSAGGKLPHFDVSVQVTIPNEFEKLADVNVGYTAGIETTKVSAQWIDKSNTMDLIIVPSNHSKDVFEETVYKAENKETGESLDFRLETPVEVCAFPAKEGDVDIPELELTTEFNFLSVAQWGPRKNVQSTITNFVKEFKDEEDVGLILKLNMAKNNVMDRIATESRVKSCLDSVKKEIGDYKCKVYLLHGNLKESEMSGLYRHPSVKAFVTTTHGEGFGLPMFEAAIAGLPIVAPSWSSYIDFLYAPKKDKKGKEKNVAHFVKIDYEVKQVQKEAVWQGVIQPEAQWCWPRDFSVRDGLREIRKNHTPNFSAASKLKKHIIETFGGDKQYEKMLSLLGEFIKIDKDMEEWLDLINDVDVS